MNLAQMLSDMAREVHHLETHEEAIDRIGQFGRIAINADDSGILLNHGGQFETASRTSKGVEEAHGSQVELNEGPCLDAFHEGASTYRCDDTITDPRWPVWGPRASKLGYRSVLSVRLATNERKFGSLNAYSAEPGAFTADDERTMEYLATHASVAIAAAQNDQHLNTALDSRTVISQAQGILMLAFDITAESAFLYMRRISQDSNSKLAVIARQIVDERHELRSQFAKD
jgi:GAF domain-containing protein